MWNSPWGLSVSFSSLICNSSSQQWAPFSDSVIPTAVTPHHRETYTPQIAALPLCWCWLGCSRLQQRDKVWKEAGWVGLRSEGSSWMKGMREGAQLVPLTWTPECGLSNAGILSVGEKERGELVEKNDQPHCLHWWKTLYIIRIRHSLNLHQEDCIKNMKNLIKLM